MRSGGGDPRLIWGARVSDWECAPRALSAFKSAPLSVSLLLLAVSLLAGVGVGVSGSEFICVLCVMVVAAGRSVEHGELERAQK